MDEEQLNGDWFGYKREASGEVIFYFNKKTGEHRLPKYSILSSGSSNEITISVDQIEPIKVHNIGCQTDEGDCSKGCASMYINPSLKANKELDFDALIEAGDSSACLPLDATSTADDDEVLDTENASSPDHPLVELQSSDDKGFKEAFTYDSHCLDNLDQQQQVHEKQETAVICELCSQVLESTREYEEHLVTHCSQDLKNCPVCKKTFKRQKQLLMHIRTHSGYKPFQCGKCSKAFTKQQLLERHKNSHKLVKPFKCEECGKTFGAKINLRIHQRIHSGDKPFKCTQCDKSFVQSHHLKRHVFMHEGEKPKPFKCLICNRAFAEPHHLRDHARIHSEHKPFKCEFCDKSFAVRSTLKNHERIHTGVTPYKCDLCDKAFKQYGSLSKHKNIHKVKVNEL